MTRSVSQASAIALGVAAFLALSPEHCLRGPRRAAPARVVTPTPATAGPATAAPATADASLSEPSPTPGWAEAGPNDGMSLQHTGTHHAQRHHGYRNANRYEGDPVRTAANGVAGDVADLGSIAAYPFYCFPNYGCARLRCPTDFKAAT